MQGPPVYVSIVSMQFETTWYLILSVHFQVKEIKAPSVMKGRDRSASGQLMRGVLNVLVGPDERTVAIQRALDIQVIDLQAMCNTGAIRSPAVSHSPRL